MMRDLLDSLYTPVTHPEALSVREHYVAMTRAFERRYVAFLDGVRGKRTTAGELRRYSDALQLLRREVRGI